jgi:EAL domain-containing protein (putative c-di-GMP-specific phosphodiesterase class I)
MGAQRILPPAQRDFHDANLPAQILATLTEHGLAPIDLTLEITESIMLDSHAGTLDILHRVTQLGIQLSMDDFGTGYSSLAYLRRLPVSALKLDKSFVRDLEHDPTARALTEAVIRIGDSLNLKVVAEGVETESQRQLLADQGYDLAQGYLFSQALPAQGLEQWMKAREA